MNRHRLPFEVTPDLTPKREAILEFARSKIGHEDGRSKVVEDVFVDMDCKLKLKTKCGVVFGFSSRAEFVSLFNRLSGSRCDGDVCRCCPVN